VRGVRIRPYAETDAAATLAVFLRAVRGTARRDYTAEQVAAWAPDDIDLERWAARRAAASTVVAVEGDRVIGFADLVDDGHVDMTFVDPDFGGRGVATALLQAVVEVARTAGVRRLTVLASITARPFFERRGFVLDEQVQVELDGVMLTTNAMSCRLP
jgi:putative acetyltransferase